MNRPPLTLPTGLFKVVLMNLVLFIVLLCERISQHVLFSSLATLFPHPLLYNVSALSSAHCEARTPSVRLDASLFLAMVENVSYPQSSKGTFIWNMASFSSLSL